MRMTSQIFIGQGYALLELSSTPETFLWRPQESSQQTDDPDGYEGEKASEDVPHPRNVRPILRTQIGLDGVVESENDDQENGAAEPSKIVVQERVRFRETIRRQPVLLIRKVDQLRRQRRDNTRNAKSDHGGKNAYTHKHSKESRFCLPAVRYSAPVEMGSHHVGQFGIVRRKMNSRVRRQRHK